MKKAIWIAAVLNLLLIILSPFSNAQSDTQNHVKFQDSEVLSLSLKQILKEESVPLVFAASTNIDSDIFWVNSKGHIKKISASEENSPAQVASLPSDAIVKSLAFDGNDFFVLTNNSELKHLSYKAISKTKEWNILGKTPNKSLNKPSLLISSGEVYLFAENEFYAFNIKNKTWKSLSSPKETDRYHIGFTLGNSFLMFVDEAPSNSPILAYNKITNVWVNSGELSDSNKILGASSLENTFVLITTNSIIRGSTELVPTKYSYIDHAVVVLLVSLLLGVGWHFTKKEKSSNEYFKAGNKMPWWAASLSIFATNSSAITLMAMPAMAFSGNWIYFSIGLFLLIVQTPLHYYIYVPLIRRLKITTANEYLEKRFGLSVRMLGFMGFSLNQVLGRMAAILLLPATAISAIFGLPMEYSILIMGVSATVFVTLGGLAAVIWTDVIQAFIMIIGVFVCVFFALTAIELPAALAFDVLIDQEKLKLFDFRIDWAAPVVIVLFLNSFAQSMTYIGDQNFVQRVQCTSSETEAKKAAVFQLFVAVPLNFILFSLGTMLFLYYFSRTDQIPPALSSDGILPYFAAQTLPAGLAGLIVVALLAATISTVSSAMNSVANLCVEDVCRRFNPNISEKSAVKLGRIFTISLGVFGTGASLVMANMSSLASLWDLFLMVTGMILAPVTGIFVLGVFTKKANLVGVWLGVMASLFANYYATFHMDVHALVYLIIGLSTCIFFGYLGSMFTSPSSKSLDGLTIFTLSKNINDS